MTSTADGGGKVGAARRVISGRDRMAYYVARVFSKNMGPTAMRLEVAEVNGEPAMLAFDGDGDGDGLAGVLCFDIEGERIAALRVMANPDKLRFLAEQLSHPAGLPGS